MPIRSVVRIAGLCCAALWPLAADAAEPLSCVSAQPWAEWDGFKREFISEDGRIIDKTAEERSISEGQSYALFFALVDNDRETFDRVLHWTNDNLAKGSLGERLPAWLWGQHGDGSWRVLDDNPAADADLWIAYSLLEAGRLWRDEAYERLGRSMLKLIRDTEFASIASVGPLLLPGPFGFVQPDGSVRINPSYYPEFQLRYLESVDPRGDWLEAWKSLVQLAPRIFPRGVAPDHVMIARDGSVRPDPEKGVTGSYDAIRVYLWAGMSPKTPESILPHLEGWGELIHDAGTPPEKVDITSVDYEADYSPLGFSAASLPYLRAIGSNKRFGEQQKRVRRNSLRGILGINPLSHPQYYDQVLSMFGTGFVNGLYSFEPDGRLRPRWTQVCDTPE